MDETKPEHEWKNKFGEEYTDRNILSFNALNKLYMKNYGISRSDLNAEFLAKATLDKDPTEIKFLEIGCNVGNQLNMIQEFDFNNLWGIEIQKHALDIARKRGNFNIVEGNAYDIPFKNNFFDIVFTSGLLIHIPPKKIHDVLEEIYRCTSDYIWGFEYYTPQGYETIKYHGKNEIMWKTDFPQYYLNWFDDLKLVHKKILKYKDNDNLDIMFLLKKTK